MKTSRANAQARGVQRALSWLNRSRLASTTEGRIVGFAAFAQGLVLVTIPVTDLVLSGFPGSSMTRELFGDLIVPDAAAGIVASLTGFGLAYRHTTRHAYRLGLALSLLSMVLLVACGVVRAIPAAVVPLMLIASVCLGAGFGLTVPVLTAYARFLNPTTEYSSVVVLHALLGLGALAAPAAAAISTGLGLWWGFLALSAVVLMSLLLVSGRMPSAVGAPKVAAGYARQRIVRFSLYTICITGYAVCASVMVIWSQLGPTHHLSSTKVPPVAPVHLVSAFSLVDSMPDLRPVLVFAIFWAGLLTPGRILFAAVDHWQSPRGRTACYFGPILVLGALIVAGVLSRDRPLATIAIFGLAAFGCSALMPLKLGVGGQKDVTVISAALVAGVVAYRLGYRIVVAGLQPDLHANRSSLLYFAIAVAVGKPMVVVAFALVLCRPAELDPHRLGDADGNEGRQMRAH
jgi:MFS family permease